MALDSEKTVSVSGKTLFPDTAVTGREGQPSKGENKEARNKKKTTADR